MEKKALCVGINDYPYEGNDLNGCVNDAKAWADLLVEHYGFPRDNIQRLFDADATKTERIRKHAVRSARQSSSTVGLWRFT